MQLNSSIQPKHSASLGFHQINMCVELPGLQMWEAGHNQWKKDSNGRDLLCSKRVSDGDVKSIPQFRKQNEPTILPNLGEGLIVGFKKSTPPPLTSKSSQGCL